ncbi:MAG: HRDC domain-containing protein [Planctomycetes bacterium]|nr:HRDC domain-containing protein [Planctomycetota bacterium]
MEPLPPPIRIETQSHLEQLAERLFAAPAIAVDTEANPLFAYYERLCLIQVSTARRDYIIDPMVGLDLRPLVPVFADPHVVKVFHDAEFDLLMLKRTMPFELAALFDTKVVAMALGLENVGLAAILQESFGVTLDKRLQRSDWGCRPLTEGQLDYARYDTRFLLPLAADLRARLRNAPEITQLEVAAEFRRVEQLIPEPRVFNPDDFIKVKGWERLDPVGQSVLRELYALRHQIADRLDRPAFKVVGNDVMLVIAEQRPTSRQAIARCASVSPKLLDRHGDALLEAVRRGIDSGPLAVDRISPTRRDTDLLSEEQSWAYDALRTWRKGVAAERGVDASLVLPRAVMLELAKLEHPVADVEQLRRLGILEPWRVDYYGAALVEALGSVAAAPHRSGARRGLRRRSRRRGPTGTRADVARPENS